MKKNRELAQYLFIVKDIKAETFAKEDARSIRLGYALLQDI